MKYQKDHEILGIDEKQNITTSKLDELNREFTVAESARMEKKPLYRLIEAGHSHFIAAAANIATTTTTGSASSLLQKLQEEHAD